MKKHTFLLGLAAIGFTTLTNTAAFAQSDVADLIFSKDTRDVTILSEAYLTPFLKGMSTGLNSGWNNTAKVKKIGRFEIRVSASGAIVPSKDKTFDITQIGLSPNIKPSNPAQVMAPTVMGSKDDATPMVDVYSGSTLVKSSVALPKGAGIPMVPAPQIQATLGLPLGIDATLRLVPTIKLGNAGSVRMIGGGLKVNVMQFLNCKKLDKIMPFDVAIAAGYTEISYDLPLDEQQPGTNFTNQSLSGKLSGWNTEAIISKKLSFFTPFLSVGYNSSKANVGIKGDFQVETAPGTYEVISNPVTIDKKGITGIRANMGFQLELFILRLYASYSIAEYNSVNAGIGIGI